MTPETTQDASIATANGSQIGRGSSSQSENRPTIAEESLPTCLHLGCGDDYHEGALNVDINPDSEADRILDVSETPWPWPDRAFSRIEAHHLVEHLTEPADFFHEASRTLTPGGQLVVTVPLGVNAKTDGDHEPPAWTHERPEQYSVEHRRPWDPTIPLRLVDRRPNVWLGGPLAKATPVFQALSEVWPAWVCERCYGGELTVVYERVSE